MKIFSLLQFFSSLMILMTFGSCTKSSNEADPNTRSCIDLASSEICFSRLLLLARHVSPVDGDFSNVGLYTCAAIDSIVGDTSDFPTNGVVTVHLSFPDTGCTDYDQRWKKGPVSITYHDDFNNVGAVAQVLIDEFYTGLSRFRGQINMAHSSSSIYEINFVDCEMYSSTTIAEYAGTSTVIILSGDQTADPSDDVYTYTSDIEGRDFEGTTYSASSSTPIKMRTDCSWNTQGYYSVEPDGRSTRTLNYGEGTCNGQFVISADGQDINVSIP